MSPGSLFQCSIALAVWNCSGLDFFWHSLRPFLVLRTIAMENRFCFLCGWRLPPCLRLLNRNDVIAITHGISFPLVALADHYHSLRTHLWDWVFSILLYSCCPLLSGPSSAQLCLLKLCPEFPGCSFEILSRESSKIFWCPFLDHSFLIVPFSMVR